MAFRIILTSNGSFIVKADVKLITRAIDNLLSNVVEYTPTNGIISVSDDSGAYTIENSLEDNLDIDTRKLWEPFVKGDDSRHSSCEGSGLGLALVKNILDKCKLKGKIEQHDKKFIVRICR